jgi:hypothetical protein
MAQFCDRDPPLRFRDGAPWLFYVSRCLGPTERRDPVFDIYRRTATSIALLRGGPLQHLSPTRLHGVIGGKTVLQIIRLRRSINRDDLRVST